MNIILQTLFSPVKAFSELKQENKFPVVALVILLLLIVINSILMVPITSKIMTTTMSSMPLPEKQLDTTLSMMHQLRYLLVIGVVFSTAITLFLQALLLYIITVVAKPAITYIKSFSLIVYSYFAILFGNLINTGIIFIRGLDKITNQYELTSMTGLNLLTTVEKAGAAIYIPLTYINPFQIWFIVLLSIVLKIFVDIKYTKALLICVIFWLITLIFPVVSGIFSEIAMNKAGLM